MGILTDITRRIKVDYKEYRDYLLSVWMVKRDNKAVRRAIKRAQKRRKIDGRTYYILRDNSGGINEFNSSDIWYWHRRGLLPKMKYSDLLKKSLHIVS